MKLIEEKNYFRAKPININERDIWIFAKEFERKIQPIQASILTDIKILPNQVLLKKGKVISEIITRTKYNKKEQSLFRTLRKKTIRLSKAIWLADIWSINYFHWFTDILPRMLMSDKHYAGIPIIFPANFNNYQFISESLKLFKNNPIVFLRNFQKIKVKEIIYLPNLAPTGNYNEELLRVLNTQLRKHFNLDILIPNKGVLIDRQQANNRKIINYADIEEILVHDEIKSIAFEKYGWNEQIKIAAEADLLIGVHGAGLTNMLFMKPGTKVLELRRKDDDKNNCYFSLASALDIDYYYLLCDIDDELKLTQENSFFVNSDSLKNTLKLIYG